jgi:type I restriction-modification system DNA methylase subunit
MGESRAAQLRLALGPYTNRKLFSDHFLEDILPTWPEFTVTDAHGLLDDLADLWEAERTGLEHANEAQTEERFVKPVLQRLGFFFTVQAGVPTASGHRQPDYALFADDDARAAAAERSDADRFVGAVAVGDAKRFGRPLDRRRVRGELSEDPVAQIIHYVAVTRTRWGILTNGRLWRLYGAEGDLIEGACLEVDLCALLDAHDQEAFRYFAALFAASALAPDPEGRCLLDRVLEGSRAQAIAVGDALRRQVFGAVPLAAEGLLGDEQRTDAALAAVFDNALVVLYRVLFCLHAEDRGLLPVENPHYRPYSLRNQRTQLARDLDGERVFSSRSDDLFNDLRALFRIIDQGDPALGVNEYNGGLFSANGHLWLHGRSVSDERMARALDLLYRVDREQVDYRDLSVRHLGTIFEQLLAFQLVENPEGKLTLAPAGGRKATGAYFTPDHIVDDIVERTLAPLLDQRSTEIADAGLTGVRAFKRLLDLHVLDPAMGSGHFLVSAAAYIARRIANDPSYDVDLSLPELQGLVAERCLYGVDVNPMAVEIARLALWLSTVRADRPLRFLANLRHGNSLVSCDLSTLLDEQKDLFAPELAARARDMLDRIGAISSTDTTTGRQAHEKERIQGELDSLKAPLLSICDQAIAPPVGPGAGRPLHWQIEYPERFLDSRGAPLPDGGFDAVIGNPPYLRIQELGRDVAEYCRQRYDTTTGSFDAYVPFIERGVSLLRPHGRLGFIVPSAFLKLEYGARLRARLAERRLVEEIIDFGHAQVFDGATNYTCIVVLEREGDDDLGYVAIHGSSEEVRRAVTTHTLPAAERYRASRLGEAPWILLPSDEREILDRMQLAGPPLSNATRQIFQGLITGADPIYIFEDRGMRGLHQVVATKAGAELELEPDLLHPLASGSDVERYALRTLSSVLLFPYCRDKDEMRLITEGELQTLPLTWEYLRANEPELRGREKGKMDHDGWWAFGRTQSLGLHDQPKLGVAATVKRLEVAADPAGAAYFHNVRVNGILPLADGPSLPVLTAVLNSRAVDFAFRRGAAPLQNGFYTANKQFIAWLPVPTELPDDLETAGARLHELVALAEGERSGFLDWLSSVIGARPRDLAGAEALTNYVQTGLDGVLAVLDKNVSRLTIDPRRRAERERIGQELTESIGRITDLDAERVPLERDVDAAVYDAYGLSVAQQARVAGEYQ